MSEAPRALQCLSFKSHNANIESEIDWASPPEYAEEVLQATSNEGAGGNEIRIFPYGEIDHIYGTLFRKVDRNCYRAWKRWDMGGWNKLREVMQKNLERMANEG